MGLCGLHGVDQRQLVEQVRAYELNPALQVRDSLRELRNGMPHEPVDLIPLAEEKFAEIGPVLAADPDDERPTRHRAVD